MPVSQKWAYFDHAAVGPLTRPAAECVSNWCRQALEEGDTVWPEWNRSVNQTRHRAAELISASNSEIALIPNTTAGISLVAEGYPWREGDNVVTLANEFPSNLYPWMNLADRGVETRRVQPDPNGRVDLDRVLASCDQRTRIVALSWIGFATGFRLELARFVDAIHQRGCLFFLDAIQGFGVFPLNVSQLPIDFLAADGHKWMLGPEGAGVLYVRREHLDLLRPVGVGWNSVVHCYDFDKIELTLKDSAGRYEGGTMNAAGFMALGASLDLLRDCGLSSNESAVADRILELTDYACEQLSRLGIRVVNIREPLHRSGIVTFRLEGQDQKAVRHFCLKSGIVLSHRNGCLRISPHAYNNEAEIDHLVDVVRTAGNQT